MKTALVTGANRGIGLEICKQLDKLGWKVILCSRNLDNGIKAAQGLSENTMVKKLDVTDENSILNLYDEINNSVGHLDVLINNAGLGINTHESKWLTVAKKAIKKNIKPLYTVLKRTKPNVGNPLLYTDNVTVENIPISNVINIMDTNVYGPWRMIQIFIPLLKKSNNPQIINVSSGMGDFKNISGKYPGYSFSKASLNILTIMCAKELEKYGVRVNAVCPGWVKTDMGGPDAPKTVEEGADTIVWLAEGEDKHTGKFFRERTIIEW